MTKPTGRPRGRPKTKEYATLMARVPQDLATRVQRYAGRRRQTISDVLRDGLLVLLQEEEPHRFYMSDINTEPENISATKGACSHITSAIKEGHVVRETQPAIAPDAKEVYSDIASDAKKGAATQDAQPSITSDMKAGDPDASITSDTKEGRHDNASDSNAGAEKASDTKEVSAPVPNVHQQEDSENTPEPALPLAATECPPFNSTKRMLGPLCPQEHAWPGTRQSLRYRINDTCVECSAERVRRFRQKRPTTPAGE